MASQTRNAKLREQRAKPDGRTWPTVVDLFCGCGGVTQGLKTKHFRVVAAVDNDPVACASYRANHRRVHLYESDIQRVDPREIRANQLRGGPLDVLVVCSPCQPFSQQNRKSREDARAKLILAAIPFVKVLKPGLVFFENVPGLTRTRFSKVLEGLRSGLETLGYQLGDPERLDAAGFGVPQRRLRCVMLARRKRPPPKLPAPTTPRGKHITVREALRDLPRLASGDASPIDDLHFARQHKEIVLQRLRHVPKDGGSRSALPPSLQLACHDGHNGHPDVYGRMSWDKVAPTLTTGCTDVTRGRFAHPRDDRAITLREAARLQTFPDRYRFAGSAKDIERQIGNAVPVAFIVGVSPVLRSACREEQRRPGKSR